MKFGFLILHYLAINETVNCVESIMKNINYENYEIIIVDNASGNGTGKDLKDKYKNIDNINVIINDKNLGFAKGNNVGFLFAVRELKCDYICMINNDTLIKQRNFIDVIIEKYNKLAPAVIGPKIKQKNGKYTPILPPLKSMDFYRKALLCDYVNLVKIYLGIDGFSLMNILNKLINRIPDGNCNMELSVDGEYEDVILHGCCLIFTPEYLKKFVGINDKTFLFREEELLYIRLRSNSLHSLYTGDLEIFHLEDAATNMVKKKTKDKKIFLCKSRIGSTKILIQEMKNKSGE